VVPTVLESANTLLRNRTDHFRQYNRRFREPSLAFYMDRRIEETDCNNVENWMAGPSRRVLIASKETIESVDLEGFKEIGTVEGLNLSKGEWTEVIVLLKRH
jgi:hypothetical protein